MIAEVLSHKTIFVTAAYSGIGSEFARQAAAAGARLILAGRQGDRLAALRRDLPGEHDVAVLDIETIDEAKKVIVRIADGHGPFDGVFHAAGADRTSSIRRLRDVDYDAVFSGSFKGACAIASACMKSSVLKDGGSIVFMSSISSKRPQPGMALYSASKAAIDALVSASVTEFAPRSVRINSIVCGAVESAMMDESMAKKSDEVRDRTLAMHPLGFGQTSDPAQAAVFLMSDQAKWITGSHLSVDGGFLAG